MGDPARSARMISFAVVLACVLLLVAHGLMAPLLTLMLALTLVDLARRGSLRYGFGSRHHGLGVAFVLILVLSLVLAFFAFIDAVLGSTGRLQQLLVELGLILQNLRLRLPQGWAAILPQQQDLLGISARWLSTHAGAIGALGLGTLKELSYLLIGLLIGLLMSLDRSLGQRWRGPWTQRLFQQCREVQASFAAIAGAQVRIALINSGLTLLYLMVALPVAGIHLPFSKTLIMLTFLGGLVPILGNLLANSVIVLLSFGQSPGLALVSLGFLMLIHKLEYFVNARIIGTRIHARAWEMLLCMLVLERFLGLAGVVMAPILYAWSKQEWLVWDQVD